MSTTKRKETRTYKDRALYMREAVKRRRKKLRELALEYGGGKCKICGYKKCGRALSFHHKDPKKKDFGIAYGGITRSWEKTRKELDKWNCTRILRSSLRKRRDENKVNCWKP
jgi:hypothetical protein